MTGDSTTASSNANVIAGVAERLCFFFSDANLRCDKFLRTELTKSPFIPLTTLLKFNSLKAYTSEPSDLINTMKQNDKCQLKLVLNDDQSGIGRKTPFTKDLMGKNVEVTLRVSNLPLVTEEGQDDRYNVTIEEVKALFEEFGTVAMVRLLHNYINDKPRRKVAYGRAFVEFESVKDMEKAVEALCVTDITNEELKPNKTLQLKNQEIRVKTMQQWLDKKAKSKEEYLKGKGIVPKENTKKRSREEDKKEEEEEAPLVVPEFTLDWTPGCIIQLTKLPEGCDREKILAAVHETFDKDVAVRADYSRGQEDGCIRFDQVSPKIAELSTKLNDGSITVGGEKVGSASVLEGDAEKEYYKKYIDFRNKQARMKAEEKREKEKKQRRH